MTLLQEMLRDGAERGASDILISAGSPVSFHINGSLVPWRDERLSAEESRELSYALLKEEGIRDTIAT